MVMFRCRQSRLKQRTGSRLHPWFNWSTYKCALILARQGSVEQERKLMQVARRASPFFDEAIVRPQLCDLEHHVCHDGLDQVKIVEQSVYCFVLFSWVMLKEIDYSLFESVMRETSSTTLSSVRTLPRHTCAEPRTLYINLAYALGSWSDFCYIDVFRWI